MRTPKGTRLCGPSETHPSGKEKVSIVSCLSIAYNKIMNFWTIFFLTLGGITFLLFIVSQLAQVIAMLRGAPFVRIKKEDLQSLLEFVGKIHPERAVDLGSGDGAIVIALAKIGIESHGYEIDPILVWYSRLRIHRLGLQRIASIHWRSFWNIDLSPFPVITAYILPTYMRELEQKLERELSPNASFLSNRCPLPTWKPVERKSDVYWYYKKPH